MKKYNALIALVLMFLLVSSPVFAGVAATLQSSYKTDRESVRNGTIAFDSSYPTNGESLTAANLDMSTIRYIEFQPTSGYIFEYDYTNSKIKVYKPVGAGTTSAGASHTHTGAVGGTSAAGASHTHTGAVGGTSAAGASHTHTGAVGGTSAAGASHNHVFTGTAQAPVIVVEEVVTVATNTGTLANVPLYIAAIHVTAGDVTGAFNVIPTGETPITKQSAVTFTTGVLTFLGTDNVTSAKVTYIPKRGSGYLSTVTVDESAVASASKVNLAARAGLVQYVWDDTDGILAALEPSGEQPTATHLAVVDINDSSNTSVDSHADDAANTLKVTYIPYTQLAPGTFIDDTDVTLSSQVWNFTGDPGVLGYHKTVIPGNGTQLAGEAAAGANAMATWEGPSGTAADNVAVWNPATNSITTAQTAAMLTTAVSWMILDADQLAPKTPAGTNAAEATHTHDATGLTSTNTAEATHTHAATGLTSTNTAEATHTHAATGLTSTNTAEATHTHTFTSDVGDEVSNTTDLSALTAVKFRVVGY